MGASRFDSREYGDEYCIGGAVATRDWGYWTEHKLDMLGDYLQAFTTASKRAGATIYLDLFAGEPQNLSRSTGEEIQGSPKRALSTRPPFSKVVLFELPTQAAKLESELRAEFPNRDLTVWSGNCNRTIDSALAQLKSLNYAATFAFVDHYAAEIEWATLEKLAAFKSGRRTKVELWMLFAHSMLPRGLASITPEGVAAFGSRIDAMFGSQDWVPIYQARMNESLDAAGFRRESTNLMRWRIEKVLGYGSTHAFEMKNTRGQPLYSMIFATDSEAGNKIMSDIYGKAALLRPQMQAEAAAIAQARREEETGMLSLFEPLARVLPAGDLYVHEPPTAPYGASEANPLR